MVHVGRMEATHRYGDDAGDDSNLQVSQNAVTQYHTGERGGWKNKALLQTYGTESGGVIIFAIAGSLMAVGDD